MGWNEDDENPKPREWVPKPGEFTRGHRNYRPLSLPSAAPGGLSNLPWDRDDPESGTELGRTEEKMVRRIRRIGLPPPGTPQSDAEMDAQSAAIQRVRKIRELHARLYGSAKNPNDTRKKMAAAWWKSREEGRRSDGRRSDGSPEQLH